jgi:hypothetical protein
MPDAQPAFGRGPLPRGHLLALNGGHAAAAVARGVGMAPDDVDLDQRIVRVLGKGRRPRAPTPAIACWLMADVG